MGSNRLSLTLAWQRNEREEFADPDAPGVPELVFNLNTFNYSSVLHLREIRSWNTSVGINGMFQRNSNGGEEVLIPEYRLFDIGSFIYSQKSWNKTTFSGGVRFDHRSLETEGYTENAEIKFTPLSRSYNNFSASLGLSHASSDRIVFRMNMASGFRAPSIPELSSNGTHEGTNRYEYGAPELKSERSVQTDLGVEMNSEHLLVTASLFYNRIGNFIFYNRLASFNGGDSTVEVDGEQIPAFRFNQQDAQLWGGEILVDLHPHPLDWLHWQNTFSYVRGRFKGSIEGEKDLPLMPAPRWISELRGEFFEEGKRIRNFQVHVEADHSFSQDHYFSAFSTETGTPGYTLLHARLSWNFIRHNRILASVFLNAQNLGNRSYQQHLSRLKYAAVNPVSGRQGVFNMGRNFSVRILVPFSF